MLPSTVTPSKYNSNPTSVVSTHLPLLHLAIGLSANSGNSSLAVQPDFPPSAASKITATTSSRPQHCSLPRSHASGNLTCIINTAWSFPCYHSVWIPKARQQDALDLPLRLPIFELLRILAPLKPPVQNSLLMPLVVFCYLSVCGYMAHESRRPQPSIQFETPSLSLSSHASPKCSSQNQPPALPIPCTCIWDAPTLSHSGWQSLAPGLPSLSPHDGINVAPNSLHTQLKNIKSPTSPYSKTQCGLVRCRLGSSRSRRSRSWFNPFSNALKNTEPWNLSEA